MQHCSSAPGLPAQDAVLVVTLQSYPTLNRTSWPSRIDFGRCALGECATRRVGLSCSVPADFTYTIEVSGLGGHGSRWQLASSMCMQAAAAWPLLRTGCRLDPHPAVAACLW